MAGRQISICDASPAIFRSLLEFVLRSRDAPYLAGRQISICDASPAIFRSLLEFVYCGHVTPENWPPEQLMELMVLADRSVPGKGSREGPLLLECEESASCAY